MRSSSPFEIALVAADQHELDRRGQQAGAVHELHARAQFIRAHDARVVEFGQDFRLPRDEIDADAFPLGIALVGKRTAEILADRSAPQPEESIAQEEQQPRTGVAQPQAERVARRYRCCR